MHTHTHYARSLLLPPQLMDEFLTAVKRRFGNTVLVQFEDMEHENAAKLLNMYRCGTG